MKKFLKIALLTVFACGSTQISGNVGDDIKKAFQKAGADIKKAFEPLTISAKEDDYQRKLKKIKIPTITGKIGIFTTSDIHALKEGITGKKRWHIDAILKIAKGLYANQFNLGNRTYIVSCPGDLVHGTTEEEIAKNAALYKSMPYANTGSIERIRTFREVFLDPLDKAGILVLLGSGNHDYSDVTRKGLDQVKKRHGSLTYAVKLGKILYISLDLYPDEKQLEWLKKTMEAEKTKEGYKPTVLAFHFNLVPDPAGWWANLHELGELIGNSKGKKERENFIAAIKGKNIQLILNGHRHKTQMATFEGIATLTAGGGQLPLSLFDENGNYEKTIFFEESAAGPKFQGEVKNPIQK